MVYVTWPVQGEDDEVNVANFPMIDEAERFIKENNLSDIAEVTEMGW